MEIESQTFTNVQLLEELVDRLIPQMKGEKSSILISDASPFLGILSHVVARELDMKWCTINIDMGILKIVPDVGFSEKVFYLTLHKRGVQELTSIKEYLSKKCKELSVISIVTDRDPKTSLDFSLDVVVTKS